MKRLVLALSAISSLAYAQAYSPEQTRIQDTLLAHIPYKQHDLETGAPNRAIGRTPGAACEAIRYFAKASQSAELPIAPQVAETANWIMSLQVPQGSRFAGGVPSTPDLPAPSNSYHYAIDAAFCADAMMHLHEATGRSEYLQSAQAFGNFLVTMIQQSKGQGICEFVVNPVSPALNCDSYVKNLVALPALRELSEKTGKPVYAQNAAALRESLVPGLLGFWEYRDTSWKRVKGPHQEENFFVYGDTIAYALRGLYEYEGASPTVRAVYRSVTEMKGDAPKTASYAPGIALAGYLKVEANAPDEYSHYYDVVTLGLLHAVRQEVSPSDYEAANRVLYQNILISPRIGWGMSYKFEPRVRGYGDISTLSALGEALLLAEQN